MLEMHHQSSLGFVIGFEAIKKDFLKSFTLFENNAECLVLHVYYSIMKWQENAQVMTQVNKVGKVMF